jgi:hypothetical protein
MDAGGVRRKEGSSNRSGRRPSRIGKGDPERQIRDIRRWQAKQNMTQDHTSRVRTHSKAQTLASRPEGRETETAHDQQKPSEAASDVLLQALPLPAPLLPRLQSGALRLEVCSQDGGNAIRRYDGTELRYQQRQPPPAALSALL